MSAELLRLVIAHSGTVGVQRAVLRRIAWLADLPGESPTVRELAAWLGINLRAAQRAVAGLAAQGVVSRKLADRQPTTYTVNVVCPPECGRHGNEAAA